MGLRVAVTGPTGEIGIAAVTALEREPAVETILGMARRPFDPAAHGWTKTTYRQGDILDRNAVDRLVADADVVIHLAFVIMGSREESARINLQGTRNVFEAAVAAARRREEQTGRGPRRLVYTSSVAAYGYHSDNPVPITEDVPPRGSPEHYYSQQKAACEAALAEITDGSPLEVFMLRPCIVAGPNAPALADAMPWNQLPAALRTITRALPMLKPVVPDPGYPLQLVHHDDVAAAIALAATAPAPPGAYNIAGDGLVTVSDVAKALGGRPVRVPGAAASAASAALSRLPFIPSALEWLHVARTSVVMDTSKAKRDLGWQPTYTSAETLAALAAR
ncbi:MAG: NAD-dependent epimerase/dehydratase family protein [Mycobacterium sp.]